MLKILLAVILFAVASCPPVYAGSTIINPTFQVYSSTYSPIFNVSPYLQKTVIVDGVHTGGVFKSYTGSVVIKCCQSSSGPCHTCDTATSFTDNGIASWMDASVWIQVLFTKVKHNAKVVLFGHIL